MAATRKTAGRKAGMRKPAGGTAKAKVKGVARQARVGCGLDCPASRSWGYSWPETTWTRTVNGAPKWGVEPDEKLPGGFAARLAEAAACKPVRDLEAKVAALQARHSTNT